MQLLLQRVSYARVEVAGDSAGEIDRGLLVFAGLEQTDTQETCDKAAARLINYRVFQDSDGKMNASLQQVGGALLLVSQFTLAADTRKGLRPSFSSAMPPVSAKALFDYFVEQCKKTGVPVATGVFGADMQVTLQNDGPVTFLLEV
ncbi:MAG: hypothetical protein RI942_327 [Pseudomonadota bacterium]|jgi:D-tyrosyl-tRNA(Tyr) deacylase